MWGFALRDFWGDVSGYESSFALGLTVDAFRLDAFNP